jgi:hypothetical protein
MTNRHDDHLAALLCALRDAESGDAAPAHVEAAVMQAWDASHTARTRPARLSVLSQFASVAAGAVVAAGLTVLGGHLRSATAVSPWLAADTSPIVILVGEPILDGEHVRLVRMRLPAATLHALGVRSTAPATGDADVDVAVDVIVGEDGVARGLSLNP